MGQKCSERDTRDTLTLKSVPDPFLVIPLRTAEKTCQHSAPLMLIVPGAVKGAAQEINTPPRIPTDRLSPEHRPGLGCYQ